METALLIASTGLAACAVVFIGLCYRKITRIDAQVWNLKDQFNQATKTTIRQIEALRSLDRLLHLNHPLPPTRGWAASPDFLWEIATWALAHRPRVIVECGCGVSTIVLARCAELIGDCRVVSLDHELEFADQTRGQLERRGLGRFASVIHAPLVPRGGSVEPPLWYALPPDMPGRIDMLVVDGPPAVTHPLARLPAGPELVTRISAGGAVFLDDAHRDGEREIIRQWQARFPEFTIARPDCEKGCVRMQR